MRCVDRLTSRPLITGLLLVLFVLSTSAVSAKSLSDVLPEPLPGTSVRTKNPRVLEVSNASKVIAADYVGSRDRIMGGVFAARTHGEVYYHERRTCNGATESALLLGVENAPLAEGHFYSMTSAFNSGTFEFALQFVVEHRSGGEILIDSRYRSVDYRPWSSSEVWNFQVWGATLDIAKALAWEVIENLKDIGPVRYLNTSPRKTPLAWIRYGTYFAESVGLIMVNSSDEPIEMKYAFEVVRKKGKSPQLLKFERTLAPGTNNIRFDIGPGNSVIARATTASGFTDQIYAGRVFGPISDGRSKIKFSDADCSGQVEIVDLSGQVLTTGCAKISGKMEQWSGLFVPLGSSIGEWVNLEGTIGISFWARSKQGFRVQVEDLEVHDYDYHGLRLSGSSSWKKYEVLFRDLKQNGWGKRVAFSDKADMISFVSSGRSSDMLLQIGGVSIISK